MINTVLIVDDEPINIHLIKGILPAEIKLQAAISGANALRQLTKSQPDVILLYLVMPEMDGFETLAKLKAMPECQHIPVIIISGNASSKDIKKTTELGALSHLKKPISKDKLMALLNNL
ncbi:response regulator [Thalassotalea eurytherma]|uniref:Response regulatory domain-containing protein n=1 Tax=Thalassotalea eurytherma TaxID=1144278 RepID=A0ABQ6GYK3_9GAMM|nr:response regulator [Thalassotalea eurytherma]GLX81026.1 hypothetical protein theurythT_04780 [Thalassotalea eurytherma]